MPSQYHMAGSTLFLGTLLLIRCVLSKDPALCEAGTYPDSVVGRCEDCRPLCTYHDDLPQECRDTCNPQEGPQCQAGTYLDSVVGRCEDCRQLCPYQSMQDIPKECTRTCNPQVSTPASKYSSSLSDGEIGVIILMVAVVVIALGSIAVIMYKPNIIPCRKPLKFPQQVSDDLEVSEDRPMRPELEKQNIV